MSKRTPSVTEFDEDSDEQDVAEQLPANSIAAVVTGTDWTTETIVSQLERRNIQLNPRFQRRDAWKIDRKSRFIESLIVGLPIPQIVLAELKKERGKFIVLDGKQRLLAILQFWGLGEGPNNSYSLSGLTLRSDLKKLSFNDLSTSEAHEADYNSLCNQAIRTVVIRNWIDTDFLHTVFLRLNTGSVSLSPQELRQALLPGPFSEYVDDAAANSGSLQKLLGLSGPDPRMRDIEILARFLAFRFFSGSYPGRMKRFLDDSFKRFNDRWSSYRLKVEAEAQQFEEGVENLMHLFGEQVARKPDSAQFNRAIFDALIYFHAQPRIRKALGSKKTKVKQEYKALFAPDSNFSKAIESDTAGLPNTAARLRIWGATLSKITGKRISLPALPPIAPSRRRKAKKRGAKA